MAGNRHRREFGGEEALARARRLSWVLTKRAVGWDPGDIERIEEDGGKVIDPPEVRQERAAR
ncbi:hypothetical protein ACFCV8_12825 [Streptomyces sp. NPDC056347]|uniref:hypothetical protein n=1 Tax=Streptomyces sp. NPDC056347 TaxID=3345790 RepID=UPI0035D65BC6